MNFLQPFQIRANQSEKKTLQAHIAQLEQENLQLKNDLAWRQNAHALLEHYVKNIKIVAAEHPGKLAIAVFSCVPILPFNPFLYALDTQNQPLVHAQHRSLPSSDDWYGRFIGYYCTLDSHLLDIYKKKKNDQGQPLAEADQKTLTGVMRDLQSPVFNEVLETKKTYRTFLPRATYGSDMVVKVFPIFDDQQHIIGMVSFTHDITLHLEQQSRISDGLKQINESAMSIMKQVGTVQEVSHAIQDVSQGIDHLENDIQELIVGVNNLDQNLKTSIRAIQMLSVNSSVEAARAGEAGRGFKVISNEIHSLTGEMAKTVHHLENVVIQIDSIKNDSVDKLYKIHELSETINTLVESLKNESMNYEDLLETISHAEASYKDFVQTMIA